MEPKGTKEPRNPREAASDPVPSTTPSVVYTYLGGGFLSGVPARDLTAQDMSEFGVDAAIIEASGLYRKE